ncbi:exodeoxyribonuclease V subunit beta [Denitrobacterium detoxificans]|uniref:UvrD-helicase domain-containing protein n=1 Tax=Denitrobacterium detoxificans TaxID=79604 RepID=UPI0026EC52B2|nr:UvrD-helicase domain-containing protein [Denitrobacterium detoxificans]
MTGYKPGQYNAITYLEGPLLICAGAGSGKTFTLTQRVAWSLLPGSGKDGKPFLDSIDQALIITYTNKAAGEIKDRVRQVLRKEGLVEEALKVDAAWISTIHSMCGRILREHALELGIDPAFELIMGDQQERALEQAVETVLVRVREDNDTRFDALINECGIDNVRSMVGKVLNTAASQTKGLQAFDLGPHTSDAGKLARELLGLCDDLQVAGTDKNKEAAEKIADALREMLQTGNASPIALADILDGVSKSSLGGKKAADLKAFVTECASLCKADAAVPYMEALLLLATEVDKAYHDLLASQAYIDTGDLIRTTLRAFREHPAIAKEYTERFRLIMVDEFQDTSQLQIDMIEQIAGPAKTHLCTVGDSQQSIYRFQGADVEVYLRHKEDMLGLSPVAAHREELGHNFRSHGDVLAFVRAICGRKGYFTEEFLDLEAATEGRPWKGEGPRIEVMLTEHPYKGGKEFATQKEAELIAQRFKSLADAGHSPGEMVILMGSTSKASVYAQAVRDQGMECVITGGSKFFEGEHVRTCQRLLKVLANPHDTESLFVVLSSDVLPVSSTDLLYLATYKTEPQGVFIRQNLSKGLLYSDHEPMEQSPLMRHATTVLRHAWDKLGVVEPGRLFLETIVESGWLSRLEAQGAEGRAQAADILKFANMVSEKAHKNGYDMARCAQAMSDAAQLGSEKPGALSTEEANAVRIMTVHASKGLEFPIVAVVDCYETRNRGEKPALLSDAGTVFAAFSTSGIKPGEEDDFSVRDASNQLEHASAICRINAEREYEEKKRLFYVAATRASAGLIVCMKHAITKDGTYKQVMGDILAGLCPGQADFPASSCTLEYGGSEPLAFTRHMVYDPSTVETSAVDDKATTEQEQTPEQEKREQPIIIPQFSFPPQPRTVALNAHDDFFSYSSIAPEGSHGVAHAQDEEPAGEPAEPIEPASGDQPANDADKATSFGSALHMACEWLALQTSEPSEADIDEALERFAAVWGVFDVERLRNAFMRWLHSSIKERSFAYAHHAPEVPFSAAIGERILEGEIDLLCYDDAASGALIVDYKTGGSQAETAAALHDKHLLQAQCYAYAALQAGFSQVEAHFVRVEQEDAARSGQPQEVVYSFEKADFEELQAIIEQ